tara:strand:- start:690 stop:1190 length:501 start_codon:yes stop_codon:yes gene_type:complete
MNKAVNLFLASGECDGVGFWLVNFTEDNEIINSSDSRFLDIYRKELFGFEGAIQVKKAINETLDILSFDLKLDRYKFDTSTTGYSSEIPLNIIEDIFDLWAYNYANEALWKKYIGLLNFRKKTQINSISMGLKGKSYEFAVKLDKLLEFKLTNYSSISYRSNDLMW